MGRASLGAGGARAAGKVDPAYAAELARRAQFLDLEGVAQVLQSFAKAGDTGVARGGRAGRELWDGLVFRLYQGKEIYGGLQKKASARNGLILPTETRTLAEVTRALAAQGAGEPAASRCSSTRWSPCGRDDGWGTTNANARRSSRSPSCSKPPDAGSTPHAVEVRFGDTERREPSPSDPRRRSTP